MAYEKKAKRPACPGCGRWVCLDCGSSQGNMNRRSAFPHYCTKCKSFHGEMRPTRHIKRSIHDDHVEDLERPENKDLYSRHPLTEEEKQS